MIKCRNVHTSRYICMLWKDLRRTQALPYQSEPLMVILVSVECCCTYLFTVIMNKKIPQGFSTFYILQFSCICSGSLMRGICFHHANELKPPESRVFYDLISKLFLKRPCQGRTIESLFLNIMLPPNFWTASGLP